MIFVTSDTHFSHTNIVAGVSSWPNKEEDCRQFETVKEHDQAIIDGINGIVGPDDTLYHLGDVAFSEQALFEFLRRVNCKNIHLLFGNHDKAARKHPHRFASTAERREITVNGQKIVLGHYAMRTWNQQHRGAMMLYGHSHGRLPGLGRSMDVGVDVAFRELGEYRPFRIEECIEMLNYEAIESPDFRER